MLRLAIKAMVSFNASLHAAFQLFVGLPEMISSEGGYIASMCPDHLEMPIQKPQVLPGIDMLPAGFVFHGRFEIVSFLGKGGMCVVYKARHLDIQKEVALKMLHRHLVVDADAIERFRREAIAATSLEHPNIVKAFSFGCWNSEVPYIAMEYLEGTSLAEVLKRQTRLSREKALPIFEQTLDALAHAHEKGVVHRDLKPSNVMLVGPQQTTVKLVDFGIAKIRPESGKELQKLTQTGALIGTVNYMSPEQCLAEPLDCRSDIYSMGCLMYEVLEGAPPLRGETSISVMHKHLTEEPEKTARLSDKLGSIVLSALAKDRASRPQSAPELKAALLNPATYKAPTSKRRANSSAWHQTRWVVLTVTCLVAGTALAAIGIYNQQDAKKLQPKAGASEPTAMARRMLEEETERVYESRLALAEQNQGSDTREVREQLENLAEIYSQNAQWAKQERVLKKLLAISQREDAPVGIAEQFQSLARCCYAQHRYTEAKSWYKKALAIRENVFSASDMRIADSLCGMALCSEAQGRLADAEPLFKRSLQIVENLGARPRNDLLWGLANCYQAEGKTAAAEQLIARARAIQSQATPAKSESLN